MNEPITFIDKYGKILLPGGSIVVVLLLFILLLYYNNRKLRAKDIELSARNQDLTNMYEELTSAEEELRDQYDLLLISNENLDKSEEKYRKLALTDPLTSLNNRTALRQFLDTYVKEKGIRWHLLYIDLDNFKDINDSRGHETGDLVLLEIAKRLKALQSKTVFLSRLGGDEFVVVVDESKGQISRFAKEIMSAVEQPVEIEESAFFISASIGISEFPKDGTNRTILLRKADMAMHHVKARGRHGYALFTEAMEVETADKLKIRNRIRKALENNEFSLYYQPQVNMATGKISGSEVLIRWIDDNGQFISPALFIPIAEEEGLIEKIDTWVYKKAAENAGNWKKNNKSTMHYSVNVSVCELRNPLFAANFIKILDEYDVAYSQVSVEITESVFAESKENINRQLQTLRDKGIRVHLDDFGTGYSSLNYLIQLPIDVLKIDKSFIDSITTDSQKEAMTKFIIDISHQLDMKVIGEGIETLEQCRLLKTINCDFLQGYHYAKPMDFKGLSNFQKELVYA